MLSCLSGLPQKSRSEFCGKRSGRRIRSCGKRSAPQSQTPCRDEVGSLPPANLEMPHCGCRYRAPAQMRSRCVGRGDASRAVKPRGTQRRTSGLCGDESAGSTAREESLLILRGGFGRARWWIAEGKTDGSLRLHDAGPYNPPASHSFGTLPYTGRAKKATPSASHSFGTSLKEGGRENCRKTLDGTRPGVLKYPQSNEQSRCGGKSTVFRPAREAPPGLEGRSGRAGNVRLPRPRPGAMSAASRRYRENEEEGNFLEIKWNRASLRLYTMYRGRRIFLFTHFFCFAKQMP